MASRTAIAAAGLGIVAMVAGSAAQAFNFGNMMNPSRWFNDRDRDRDYYGGYGGGPYGYGGGPYGYGGGPYGGYGGPYGWGGGPWGGGYGGYPSTIVVSPPAGSSSQAAPPPPRLPE